MENNLSIKIAVVGAESTGKTTLCQSLAAHFEAALVPEYARLYFQKANIHNYQIKDLELIAQKQFNLENEIVNKTNALVFCDTNIHTIKIWAELEFNFCPHIILNLMQQCKYDFFLITANDLPWQKDDLRQNKFSRDLIFQMNLSEVKKTNTAFKVIEGTNAIRLNAAINAIKEHFKLS